MFSAAKPYSAVSVHIDRLTGENYPENDLSGIPDLVEVIRLQDTGPTEAARAIRKKLKYGNMHRQLRALTILDGLIDNAGVRFQRTFADEPLLERLRQMPRDEMVDPDVRKKCNSLYRQWAAAYKSTPGLGGIASLSKQLPQTKKAPQPSQSKVIRETEADVARETRSSPPRSPQKSHFSAGSSSSAQSRAPIGPGSTGSSSGSSFFRKDKDKDKDKKGKAKPFNLEKEKGQLLETIAAAHVASTNLINGLKLINREHQRVSENAECKNRFEKCKTLRRQILRYIHYVESEQYIGSLLSANDDLVKALMTYEVMDKSIDDDSDSDAEYQAGKAAFQRRTSGGQEDLQNEASAFNMDAIANAPPIRPPRPTSIAMPPPVPHSVGKKDSDAESEEEVDDNDPFADTNAVKTPFTERSGMTWRDV